MTCAEGAPPPLRARGKAGRGPNLNKREGRIRGRASRLSSCIKELGSGLGFDLGLRLGKLESSF